MLLYVLRHGKAGEGYPDESRELTDRGRTDLDKVLSEAKERIADLKAIHSSPLVRAQQTADIARSILAPGIAVQLNEKIVPWSEPAGFSREVDSRIDSLLIASHQPFVSTLVEYLSGDSIPIGTSTLVALEMDYIAMGCAEVSWVITPK